MTLENATVDHVTSTHDALADRLLHAIQRDLGTDPATWTAPAGYPHSLALCTIDSIASIGVRYATVEAIVNRYRQTRAATGANADTDTATDLLETFAASGSVNAWANTIGTRHRTSTRPKDAPLKAQAMYDAAHLLAAADITTTQDVRDRARSGQLEPIKKLWLALPGQRSEISWRYLLILAGVENIKPDRMLHRYLAHAIGTPDVHTLDNTSVADQFTEAARTLGTTPRTLDHAIWRWTRSNLTPTTRAARRST